MEGLVTGRWQERRVLVTGGTGIVGSWLVRRLVDEGAAVVVLVCDHDPQSELVRSGTLARTSVVDGRLEDIRVLERAITLHDIDTVFHLGAQTLVGSALRDPLGTFESNIRGTYNLLEACRVHRDLVKRVVVASSDKAYGEVDTLPYTEDMPMAGRHPYDVSKSCTDLLARTYGATYGLPVSIARCGNVFGGGDLNWSRLVPGTMRSLLHDERPVLRSDGLATRDYIFVEDVVDAYLALAEHLDRTDDYGEAFNFSTDRPLSALEIVAAITRLLGSNLEPRVLDEARFEIAHQHLDSRKARRLLDWEPRWSIEDGLAETGAWYREYLGISPVRAG